MVQLWRVLVVDDEESVRFSLNRFLTGAGFEVFLAADVPEAQAMLEAYAFRVAIVDRVLPYGQSGLDLLSHIRQKQPACEMILLSASPLPELATCGQIFASLSKPVRKKEVLRIAEEVVRRGTARDEMGDPGGSLPGAYREEGRR